MTDTATAGEPRPAAAAGSAARAPHETGPVENVHHARRWLILAVIGIAQLMIVLDATIVTIALPDAQKALGFNNGDRQWIVTAYSLAFGGLLLFSGRLADLIGRKRTFILGLIGFGLASALGGAAPNFEVLVTARALQGAAGALLAPAALSLLTTTFTEPKERGTAFAVFGGIAGSGAAIGMLLGGLLTEYFNWRWTLFVNVGFTFVALAGAFTLLHTQRSAHRPRLDLFGTVIVSGALFCLVYGFSNAASHPWSAPSTWVFLVAAAVGLTVFGWWQTRTAHPLLPLRILLDRDRGGSFAAVFISGAGMFGVFLFLTYYLQTMLGYSPVRTGLAFLPMVAILMLAATLATTRLLGAVGARPLVTLGMALSAAGMAWLTGIAVTTSYTTHILGPLLIVGVGIGLVIAPAMSVATFGVDPDDAGVASALVNTMQQIGGSIGTALLNTLATAAATSYLVGRRPTPPVLAQAQLHSYTTAFWWSAGIFALGAIVSGLLLRPGVQHSTGGPDAAPAVHT
ncbi:MFS transporter [Actinocrinis puniceicyclus]|uniref:MFS transporter n=1 Tax=Actinocrinis puniceicyclus TaxID=977794 RepID=A0A8J7WKD5_9ACTN|nr:MFS transporter [Actinocrinis puniceicyclus]MBS2962928.1 MFS transporter [Actinocrinis puniceicyclus]